MFRKVQNRTLWKVMEKLWKVMEGHRTMEHSRVFSHEKVYKELTPTSKDKEPPLPSVPFWELPLKQPPLPQSLPYPSPLSLSLIPSIIPSLSLVCG